MDLDIDTTVQQTNICIHRTARYQKRDKAPGETNMSGAREVLKLGLEAVGAEMEVGMEVGKRGSRE